MTSIRSASRPHTAMTEVPQGQMIALFTCNRCHRVLQGTCFRTACDCIFCEVSVEFLAPSRRIVGGSRDIFQCVGLGRDAAVSKSST